MAIGACEGSTDGNGGNTLMELPRGEVLETERQDLAFTGSRSLCASVIRTSLY
jgi:hypothetical protein